ncbi:gamma-glutamyltransferase [Caulobacter segnis]|uniref:gamma-glutamyltransferase n=1 Tax=Caulobacter segnis TaxID=88688 RepID=UPI00240F72DC|nr:gamma-glutamyltransferase [Caulobacter segnis]MDG2523682.1 gamma-glutamyltransferase [Caulobacter segnis]
MRRLLSLAAALALSISTFSAASAAPASTTPRGMVAAANPLAVEAGLRVLRDGGSAVDAAVAVQAVLGLVEPQSSGLGGGAFMTYYDAKTGKLTAYNGRETAPAGASADMFIGADGKPLPYIDAILSGRSTGAPGAVAMLALAQKQHGAVAWSTLFKDAEKLAADGFVVSPRLAQLANLNRGQAAAPDAIAYFTKADGTKIKGGDVLKNPAYAETVRRLAKEGPRAMYEGAIPAAIAAKVRQEPVPGTLTAADIKAYQPKVSEALCQPYRVYVVCVPPPPSSGVGLLQALAMLERTDIATRGPNDAIAWVQLAEAERVMYADRDRYVGDPDFVQVPVKGLLDPAYVAERAKLIGDRAGPVPTHGTPPGFEPRGADKTQEPGGTTHFVVVDPKGNVVSMTTTVESLFGSGRMVAGFFLNNQLTDFSRYPEDLRGGPLANTPAPFKRPRSSMAPAVILKDGKFYAAVGSPGGNAILSYNLKAIVGLIDWNLSMQQAIDLPNMVARGDAFSSEVDRYAPGVADQVIARGLAIKAGQNETSGLHGVVVRPGGVLEGGADPRREGVAKGL